MANEGTDTPHAVVVGAGIGGLCAALALHRQGWRVTVCERGDSGVDGGAGIGLTPNALRALDAIGAGDLVRRRAAAQETGGIRVPSGRWLARSDLAFIRGRFGDSVVGLRRADLLRAIAENLPPGGVYSGVEVLKVDPGTRAGPARVVTTDGELSADLVVGADGIRSAVRSALFPEHPGPVYAGYTSWRFVVPAGDAVEASETWGRGTRFGIMHLPGDLVHCSATAVTPARERNADERGELLRRFGDWHAPIPGLIESADPAAVLHHDVEEFREPLPAFHRGRVVLVGDSAHPMTPNLGPACLAMEDAAVLGRVVRAGSADVTAAVGAYSRLRISRTTFMTRRSRQVGAAGQWSSRPAVALRDLGIRIGGLCPPRLTARALDSSVDWWPPP